MIVVLVHTASQQLCHRDCLRRRDILTYHLQPCSFGLVGLSAHTVTDVSAPRNQLPVHVVTGRPGHGQCDGKQREPAEPRCFVSGTRRRKRARVWELRPRTVILVAADIWS